MKRIIALLLPFIIVFVTGCSNENLSANINDAFQEVSDEPPTIEEQLDIQEDEIQYDKLSDDDLQRYVEDAVYSDLVYRLADEGYYVENVEVKYISKEYLEELEYNSKENVYFGYTLSELEDQFDGKPYLFTVGENGETVVEEMEDYDDTYERVFKNVAVGSGVILICITVSVATGGAAPAVSMVFAASAKSATVFALSSGTISGSASGIVTGLKTKDAKRALKAAALNGSEAFKWGAITGALAGGATEAAGLHGATANGLSANEAAQIQKESKYPLDVIKEYKSMEQYQICKEAGLHPQMVNGNTALVREIDWNYTDEMGRTNFERVLKDKLSPIDPVSGKAYELHHIGQKTDSTLAILTKSEHMQGGNDLIWHDKAISSTVHAAENEAAWAKQKEEFWKALAEAAGGTL